MAIIPRNAFGAHVGRMAGDRAYGAFQPFGAFPGVPIMATGSIAYGLPQGIQIGVDQPLVSPNGQWFAVLQSDGNFVVYQGQGSLFHSGGSYRPSAAWAAGTSGAVSAVMQVDGNFVLYDANNRPVWATGTVGKGDRIVMQDDGNLVVYLGAANSDNAHWASQSNGDPHASSSFWSTLGTIAAVVGAGAAVVATAGAAAGIIGPVVAAGIGAGGLVAGTAAKVVSSGQGGPPPPAASQPIATPAQIGSVLIQPGSSVTDPTAALSGAVGGASSATPLLGSLALLWYLTKR